MDQLAPEVMNLEEAAAFLRLSRSTLYQRPDIPRHRLPASREYRFLKEELLVWLKSGDKQQDKDGTAGEPARVLDIASQSIYHRRHLYR